jgi:hypothetical protein
MNRKEVRALMGISIRQFLVLVPAMCALTACGGSDAPNPLANWTGKTFLLDTPAIKSSNWRDPKGAGDALSEFVPQLLIGVEAGTGDSLKITLSTALSNEQDECNPTTEATVSGVKYPELLISAASFPIRVADADPSRAKVVASTAHNVSVKNVLPGTTADTPTSELIATLDVSELYPLAYRVPNASKETVCQTFKEEMDKDCEACPHNNEPWCITVRAVQVAATSFDKPLKKISSSEIPASCP